MIFVIDLEDTSNQRSSLLPLSLTDLGIIQRNIFTDREIIIIKKVAPEKIHRQRILKECVAVSLLEKYFYV